MKKYLQWGIIICVLIASCFAYAHVNNMHCLFDEDIDPGYYTVINMEENVFCEQNFQCEEKKIDGVNIKLVTSGTELNKVVLNYEICDESGRTIRSDKISGSQLKSNKYNKLKFDTIEDARGKSFKIRIWTEKVDANNIINLYQAEDNLVMKYYSFRFDMETFAIACSFCLYIFFFMKLLFKLFRE